MLSAENLKRLNREISKDKKTKSFALLLITFFYGGIGLSFFNITLGMITFLISMIFLIFFLVSFFAKSLEPRLAIAYCLEKIAEDIRKKKNPEKYLEFLYSTFENNAVNNEEKIKLKGYLFEKSKLKTNQFKLDLMNLALAINYAEKNNLLNRINYRKIERLSALIINQNEEMFTFSHQLSQEYSRIEPFQSIFKKIGRILKNNKFISFILTEIIIILILGGIYLWGFKNIDNLLIGLYTLTAASASIIFLKK